MLVIFVFVSNFLLNMTYLTANRFIISPKMPEEMEREIAQLREELIKAKHDNEQLNIMLKRTQLALSRARLISEGLPLWIMSLAVVGLVISCKYAQLVADR